MSLLKQLPMNFLKKGTLLMFLALGLFTTSLVAQDATAASLYNKGLASLKAKDYETGYPQIMEALKAAEAEGNDKVATLAKKNGAKAAYNLGSTKRKAKAYDEALELFNKGIELNPTYSSNYMGKAQALDGKGEKTAAVEAYIGAADLAEKDGKADRAVQLVKKAGSIVGKLYSSENYAGAIEAGKAHLALKENDKVHYYLGQSLSKTNDNANAVTHINKAVELATASGTAVPDKYYWAQGNILEATGNKADALAAYKKITGEKYKANADFKVKELSGK